MSYTQHVANPEVMKHAMARQAEAERERSAKNINAEVEFQAAARLNDAADVISRNPITIQLRSLQTLIEVSQNSGSTIVFPLPLEILRPLVASGEGRIAAAADCPERARLDQALVAARAALDAATTETQRLTRGEEALGSTPATDPATYPATSSPF